MKKTVFTVIVLTVFISAGIAMSKTFKEITKKSGIRVQGNNITAEVRINDIPLCKITPDDSSCVRGVSSYLIDKDNTIEIISSDKKGEIWARVYEINSSETTMVFSTDAYKDEDIEGQILKVDQLNKKVTFTSSAKGLDWEWKNNIVLDSSDEKEAIAFVKSIYTSLQKGDYNNYVLASEPLHINQSQIINNSGMAGKDIDKNTISSELRNDISRILKKNDPIWKWDNFDDLELVIVKIAGGKLYDLRRKDGSSFIRTSQDDKFERFGMANKIGKKNGQWFFFLH